MSSDMPYPFKHKPYAHQLACFNISRDAEYFGLGFDMGAGKSKALIDTAASLYDAGRIDGVVILAPRGPYLDWQDNHFPTHMPDHIKYDLVTWRSPAPKSLIESFREIAKPTPGRLHIVLMNIEAVLGEMPEKILRYILSTHRALMAIDESTTIGNMKAQRTKKVLELGKLAKFRRVLTGDSAPNSPLTTFAQCEFLKPGALGYKSFYAFKNDFCNIQTIWVNKSRGGDAEGVQKDEKRKVGVVKSYRDVERLQAKMSKFWFIVKKEDCLDLPPKIYMTRNIEMGPKQKAAYISMRDQAVAFLERTEGVRERTPYDDLAEELAHSQMLCSECEQRFPVSPYCPYCGSQKFAPAPPLRDTVLTATSNIVLTQMLKLHQIACGFVTTDSGEEVGFGETNPKLAELMDLLEESSGKVIIWANYRYNIKEITAALTKKYGERSVASYFGDTAHEARREFKVRFQDPSDSLRFGVINPMTGKYGLQLTASSTSMYYSNLFDNEARRQSEDRNHRIGQLANSVTYFDMPLRDTIEVKILNALRNKQHLSELISPSNWRKVL